MAVNEDTPTSIVCSSCGATKPSDQFEKRRRQCRQCRAAYSRTIKAKPEVRARKNERRRTESGREQARLYSQRPERRIRDQEYRSAPEAKERKRLYDAERNSKPEIVARKIAHNQLYQSIPEVKERRRLQSLEREQSPEWQERRKKQRKTDRYRVLQAARNREREKREDVKIWRRYRNAMRRSAGGSYTANDIERIRIAQKCKCAICKKKLKGDHFHIDHITPIRLEGTNHPRNLQLLCPACNLSKGGLDPIQYMQRLGLLL